MYLKLKYKKNMSKHTLSTLFSKFSHIGEVKLFEYIIVHLDKNTMRWDYNDTKAALIESNLQLAKSSQFRYLKSMVSNGILTRLQKGVYQVNPEWMEYGK